MYVSSVSDVSKICCNCYIWMLQKVVDLDVAHIAYFASVFRGMLQAFVQNVSSVSYICCSKCFILMLHMFHIHVACVLSGCCICFTHMLQQYVQMFHLCQMYVASKCFMLQVFYVGIMSDGRMDREPMDGAWRVGASRRGRSELGAGSRVSPTRRERAGSGEGAGQSDKGRVRVRGGGEANWGRLHVRIGARQMEAGCAGVHACVRLDVRPIKHLHVNSHKDPRSKKYRRHLVIHN
jgi:hypothetical protein